LSIVLKGKELPDGTRSSIEAWPLFSQVENEIKSGKDEVKFFEEDWSGRVDSNRPRGSEPDSAAFQSVQRISYFQSIDDQSLFGSLLKPVALENWCSRSYKIISCNIG
jgi:hypothetical protein